MSQADRDRLREQLTPQVQRPVPSVATIIQDARRLRDIADLMNRVWGTIQTDAGWPSDALVPMQQYITLLRRWYEAAKRCGLCNSEQCKRLSSEEMELISKQLHRAATAEFKMNQLFTQLKVSGESGLLQTDGVVPDCQPDPPSTEDAAGPSNQPPPSDQDYQPSANIFEPSQSGNGGEPTINISSDDDSMFDGAPQTQSDNQPPPSTEGTSRNRPERNTFRRSSPDPYPRRRRTRNTSGSPLRRPVYGAPVDPNHTRI